MNTKYATTVILLGIMMLSSCQTKVKPSVVEGKTFTEFTEAGIYRKADSGKAVELRTYLQSENDQYAISKTKSAISWRLQDPSSGQIFSISLATASPSTGNSYSITVTASGMGIENLQRSSTATVDWIDGDLCYLTDEVNSYRYIIRLN